MSQVEKKTKEPVRCNSVYVVPQVEDTPEHDNEHANESHQCDLTEGHELSADPKERKHVSVIKAAKNVPGKPEKPHAEAIYWD